VLGVLNRECELTLQTRVAHPVPTCKLDCLVDGKLIIHAHQTIDSVETVS
jgi:hypothetical protein